MAPIYCVVKLIKKATKKRQCEVKSTTLLNHTKVPLVPNSALTCRICLKSNGTIPIFPENGSLKIQRAIKAFAGLPLKADDGYPKHLCEHCYNLLQSAILFRATAKKSYKILINTENVNQDESLDTEITTTDTTRDNSSSSRNTTQKTRKQSKRSKTKYSILNEYYDKVEIDKTGKIIRVKCRICLRVLKKSCYVNHYNLHVDKNTRHVCDVCGKCFRSKNNCEAHRTIHTKEFPFKCQYCPYRGRTYDLLSRHKRVHSEEYKYKCPLCPAKYNHSSNLMRHSYTHKEPTIQCSDCNRKFHTQQLLKKHYEVNHLGIRQHACSLCGATFGDKRGVRKHEIKVHKSEKMNWHGRLPSYLAEKDD